MRRCSTTTGGATTPSQQRISTVTGDGVGRELITAATAAVDATGAAVHWEHNVTEPGVISKAAINSLMRTGVGLTGHFNVGEGPGSAPSANVRLYQKLDLFANVVHAFELPGLRSLNKDVDIVVIRENTEGEYSGMEHEVVPGVAESIKVRTRENTTRIASYAFEYAHMNNRKKVTAVHKAMVMKLSDGVFLDSCRELARLYPDIEYEEITVDSCMMELVSHPDRFDVILTPNLYGSLISNVVAGLTTGVGTAPGACMGSHASVFEQGVRHTAMDIAGKDLVNPTAIMLSSSMMLRHILMASEADLIDHALYAVLTEGSHLTRDQGGTTSTSEFTQRVVEQIHALRAKAE